MVARGPLLGAFVRASRLHPLSLSLWLATLRRAAGSRLLLLQDSAASRLSIAREAAAAGVDVRRLAFVGFAAKEQHVTRHALLSLVLDTSPLYAAHTTAADALRQGVPLLPLPGAPAL